MQSDLRNFGSLTFFEQNIDDIPEVPEPTHSIELPKALADAEHMVEMDKGDFIGHDALVSKDTRSCLFGITCETATPASGAAVLDGDVAVGHVTAGIPSPTLGLGVGYVRFDAPGDWVGRSLTMRLPDGSTHDTQIVDVPFFDREKAIVRGLDRSIPKRPTMGTQA